MLSEHLGHSAPAFMIAAYQHALPDMQVDAAAIFARLITDPTIAEPAPWPRSQ